MKRVAAVILAAGASTRLGEPKQLVVVRGERLLDRAIRVALASGCDPVVVVLGAGAERIRQECGLGDVQVIVNADWQGGMASSIRAGIEALGGGGGGGGAILMTCDQPAVSAAHLRRLAAEACGEPVASSYAERRGVPAYFPALWFEKLRNLEGDAGARVLLAGAKTVSLADGDLDVDTVEALERARRLYG